MRKEKEMKEFKKNKMKKFKCSLCGETFLRDTVEEGYYTTCNFNGESVYVKSDSKKANLLNTES